jgi:hypothetical protein
MATLVALMMVAVSTSETSVNFYEIARRNVPENEHLQDKPHSRYRTSVPAVQTSTLTWCNSLKSSIITLTKAISTFIA